jgi:hypothetical protein
MKGEQYTIGGSERLPRKKAKTGGSDPTFSAFSRPKSFVGSLPPVDSDKPSHTTDTRRQQNFASRVQSELGT